jgi:WD40 repeat protein
MVTLYDGKPVPKVIDFGVAKATEQKLTERTLFTQYGTMVGTLEYMSPEQAEMSALGVDTRSDIYSLGVLLYELLTGSTPLSSKQMKEVAYAEILRLIREEEPPKPSTRLSDSGEALASISAQRHTEPAKLSKLMRGELDWIVMKTLEKDRGRRYETASSFAADVQRYLDDETVQACPPSTMYRFRKFARRNRVAFSTSTLVLAALVVGTFVSTWQAVRATKAEGLAQSRLQAEQHALNEADGAKKKTEKERDRAVRAEKNAQTEAANAKAQGLLARRRFCAAQLYLAQQSLEAGNIARTLDLLETQRPKFDEEDLRTVEWYYLWQQCHRGHRLTLQGWKGETRISPSGGPTRCLAISPDGRTLAAAGWDRHVRLWDLPTGRLRATLEEHSYGVICVAYSPDGKTLASGSYDTTVVLWDVETHQVTTKLSGRTGPIWAVAFSPDSKMLATGSQDNAVQLWNLATGQSVATLLGHKGGALSVAFSPDGQTVASGSYDGMVKIWDVAVRAERLTLAGDAPVAFSPDGSLASGRSIRLWDVQAGKERSVLPKSEGAVCLDFSPHGNFLAWGTQDRHVMVCDLASGEARIHHGRSTSIQCVTFSPDGQTLVSAADDGKIEVWGVAPESEPAPLKQSNVRSLVFSRDGRIMASASHETATVVDVATGHEIAGIRINPSHGGAPCALSPDGKTLAAAGQDRMVRLFNAATGLELASLQGHTEYVYSVTFSPDGKTLASGSNDGSAILWEVASRQPRATLRHKSGCTALAFSPDGQLLATACHEGLTMIWDVATGKERLILEGTKLGHHQWIWAAAFSPDSKLLATAGSFGAVKLWDARTGVLRASLTGHTGSLHSVAFFPDGQTLVAAGDDGVAKFWDPATGQERITLKNIYRIGVAPVGKTMAFAVTDGTVRFWHGADDAEAQAYQTELAPNNSHDPLVLVHAGDHLHASGRHEESAQCYRQAISRLEKLAGQNSKVPEYQAEQVYGYLALSLVLRAAGRSAEADQSQRQGLVIHRKLAADHADAPDLQAAPLDRLAVLSSLLGTTAEAGGKGEQILHLVLAMHEAVPSARVWYFGFYGLTLNNLAWPLATSPDPKLRNPVRAVELAKRAVELKPKEGSFWNTLGVAHYRAGDWGAAVAALEKSGQLRQGGDSFDWFFLAMAHQQLGDHEQARHWYDQGVQWMEKNKPEDEELKRFRAEATEFLGVKEKKD